MRLRSTRAGATAHQRRVSPWAIYNDFTTGVLDSRITFSRASTAWGFNSAGVLVPFAAGQPRFAFDPVTLQPTGLQIEAEARTNLCVNSRVWSAFNGTSGAQTQAGVDAAANAATLVTETGGTSQHFAQAASASFASGTTYAISLFVKPGTATRCQLTHTSSAFPNTCWANFELTGAGSVTEQSGQVVPARIEALATGFYRCTVVVTATATSSGSAVILAGVNGPVTGRLPSYASTGATLICDVLQTEVGASASSPILTAGSAVTRAADVVNVTGANFPASLAAASEYTLFADSRLDRTTTATTYPMPLRIGTTDNASRASLYFTGASTNLVGEVVKAVDGFQGGVGGAAAPGLFHRIAFRAQTNNLRASVNGVLSVQDTVAAVPAGVIVRADIGAAGFMGHIRAFGIAPVGMPDAELLALTAA